MSTPHRLWSVLFVAFADFALAGGADPVHGQSTKCMDCGESYEAGVGYGHYFVLVPGSRCESGNRGEARGGETVCRECTGSSQRSRDVIVRDTLEHGNCHADLIEGSCSTHSDCGSHNYLQVAFEVERLLSRSAMGDLDRESTARSLDLVINGSAAAAAFVNAMAIDVQAVDCGGVIRGRWALPSSIADALQARLNVRADRVRAAG